MFFTVQKSNADKMTTIMKQYVILSKPSGMKNLISGKST
jgi:hypothetical protein